MAQLAVTVVPASRCWQAQNFRRPHGFLQTSVTGCARIPRFSRTYGLRRVHAFLATRHNHRMNVQPLALGQQH